MSYGRKAALIAILLGSSTIASPVLAQVAGEGEIIMRRPLPNMGGTPFVPTTPDPDCPPGDVCTPFDPDEDPNPNDMEAHGWDANCNATPPTISCLRLAPSPDGMSTTFEYVADSFCMRPNHPSIPSFILQDEDGNPLIAPGQSVNVTEYCENGGGDPDDDVPYDDDTVAIGWYDHCDEPELATCERITVGPSGYPQYEEIDSSFCDAAIGNQTLEQLALVEDSGDLPPGNYDWVEYCGGGGPIGPEPDPCDVIVLPPDGELGGDPVLPPPGCEPGGGDPNGDLPGLSNDPDLIVGSGDPPSCAFSFEWEVGAWQGSAQCGVGGTLYRQISCVALSSSDCEGPGVIGMSPLDNAIRNASFDGQGGSLEAEGQLILAQFLPGPGDGPFVRTVVDPYYCTGELMSSPPPTNYSGPDAGCEYDLTVEEGEWYNPYGGSTTCSADAVRHKNLTCHNSSGDEVDLEYCILDLREGGQLDVSQLRPDFGNFESCSYGWQQETYSVGCHPSGSPTSSDGGPVHYGRVEYECLRDDGMPASDESQCGPKPSGPAFEVLGTCSKTFNQGVWDGMCPGHNPRNYTIVGPQDLPNWRTVVFPGGMFSGGAQACVDAGSTCCEQRWNDTLKRTETVGSNQPVSRHSDWFTGPSSPSYRLDDGNGPNVHYGSNAFDGDGTYLQDHGFERIITGSRSGYSCHLPVGTIVSCDDPYACTSEITDNGLVQCKPSTAHWKYDNQHRVIAQGASGVVWEPDPY